MVELELKSSQSDPQACVINNNTRIHEYDWRLSARNQIKFLKNEIYLEENTSHN